MDVAFESFLTMDGPFPDPIGLVRCPSCAGEYQRVTGPVRNLSGQDSYKTGRGGLRGDALVIPFEGECGSRWELVLAFHKGQTGAFGQLITTCSAPRG